MLYKAYEPISTSTFQRLIEKFGMCLYRSVSPASFVVNVALAPINLTLFDAIKRNLVVPITDNVVCCLSEYVHQTI